MACIPSVDVGRPAICMYVCELMDGGCPDGVLVVHVVRKVHVDGGSTDVGVLSRVNSCKVLVIDKHRAV